MASIGATVILLAIACVPHGSFAATLNGERDSVVRRESNRVQLSSNGEMMVQQATEAATEQPTDVFTDTDATEIRKEQCDRNCHCDYPVGIEKTSTCNDATREVIIDNPNTCEQAAALSGAKTLPSEHYPNFEISNVTLMAIRPKGCYKEACPDVTGFAGHVCYFYNDVPTVPSDVAEGFPICARQKHVFATATPTDSALPCPAGYEVIEDETECRAVASCHSDLTAAPLFRIGQSHAEGRYSNASKHLDWKPGCVADYATKMLYWNNHTNLGACTVCGGNQLCKVSAPAHWR